MDSQIDAVLKNSQILLFRYFISAVVNLATTDRHRWAEKLYLKLIYEYTLLER